jgi:hypothetical protein
LKVGRAPPNDPSLCFGEVGLIDFKSDESFHTAALRCHGGISDAKEWINHHLNA